MKDQNLFNYRKSTFSPCDRGGGRCVEVAIEKNKIFVRNSRNKSIVTEFTHEEWDAFIRGVKQHEFDISQ